MPKQLTTEEFIRKAKEVHGDKYDYSLVDYKNNSTKVKIIYEGVVYEQNPNGHLRGFRFEPFKKKDPSNIGTKEFIKRAISIHGNKYDYSLVDYKHRHGKVKIVYNGHIYEQNCASHLKGQCPENKKIKFTNDIFIEKARKVHGDKYDYSLVDYKTISDEIQIIYNGKIYIQRAYSHLSGTCPTGTNEEKISIGCARIKLYLERNSILFQLEYKFDDCKHVNVLLFDFFLPEYNILIEFDGRQHFQAIDFFGGHEAFELTKIRDSIKNEYCKKNRIPLLRIPYFAVNNIDKLLEDFIFCYEHHL